MDSFRGEESNTVLVSIDSETTIYSFCQQSLLSGFAFPAVPSLLNDSRWMSSHQANYTEIYGWSSLLIVVMITVTFAYSVGYKLNKTYTGTVSQV